MFLLDLVRTLEIVVIVVSIKKLSKASLLSGSPSASLGLLKSAYSLMQNNCENIHMQYMGANTIFLSIAPAIFAHPAAEDSDPPALTDLQLSCT